MNGNEDISKGRSDIGQQLSAYLDGELSDAEVKRVEQAVAADETLAEELRQLRATRDLLQSVPKASAPTGFAERVAAQARQRNLVSSPEEAAPDTTGRWLRIGAVAAMLICAVGLGVMLSQTWLKETRVEQPDTMIAANEPRDPVMQPERKLRTEHGGDIRAKESNGSGPAAVAKSGERADGQHRERYLLTSNIADARRDALASLDKAGISNELNIYVDDVTATQQTVEHLMVANDIALAPDDQNVVLPSQAVNLNRNVYFNASQNRAPQPETEEVQYLVYGSREQLAELAKALESNVVQQQRVSQLPEPLYRQAIETPELAGLTAAKLADAAKPEEQPAAPSNHAYGVEIARSGESGQQDRQSKTTAETIAKPAATPEPVRPAEPAFEAGRQQEESQLARAKTDQDAETPRTEVAKGAAPARAEAQPGGQAAVAAAAEPAQRIVLAERDEKLAGDEPAADAPQQMPQPVTLPTSQAASQTEGESLAQRVSASPQMKKQAPSQPTPAPVLETLDGVQTHRLDELLEEIPADAMVITIRRRVPDARLNALQQRNLNLLERQVQSVQQPSLGEPNAAPAIENDATGK